MVLEELSVLFGDLTVTNICFTGSTTQPSNTAFETIKHNMNASVLDKIKQEIISLVSDVFIFYHIVLIDMLDFKNLI
jgi:hypothetical protein